MNTKGWDTVSVIKRDKVNEEFAKNWGKLDPVFSYRLDSGESVTGTFASWSIADGGGGKLLRMKMPIQSGEIRTPDVISLAGVTAYIDISLLLMPKASSESILKTNYQRLVVAGDDLGADDTGWVKPVKLEDPSGKVGLLSQFVLVGICEYLISHPNQFEQVFAEVNFAKSGCPSWALPKRCAYSYLDSGHLAILAVCTDRDISQLPLDVDVSGISLNSVSTHVLSNQMFLKNLIIEGLTKLYQNCSSGDFDYANGEYSNNRRLYMKEIKSGAIYYTPTVYKGRNLIRAEGGRVAVNYAGFCDLYAGIDMEWDGWAKLSVSLSGGTLNFTLSDSSFHHSEDIPWYLIWLSPIVHAIVRIVVAVISSDLADAIRWRLQDVRAANLNCVGWTQHSGASLTSVSIHEALTLEYK